MPTVKVIDLINRAHLLLREGDLPGARWSVTELQKWLNDAYREIVNLRPDANAQVGTFTCVAGSKQTLTTISGALRLLDVVKNASGWPVEQIDRRALDSTRRSWHAETATADVELFVDVTTITWSQALGLIVFLDSRLLRSGPWRERFWGFGLKG